MMVVLGFNWPALNYMISLCTGGLHMIIRGLKRYKQI